MAITISVAGGSTDCFVYCALIEGFGGDCAGDGEGVELDRRPVRSYYGY
jgi:hypothetical protein